MYTGKVMIMIMIMVMMMMMIIMIIIIMPPCIASTINLRFLFFSDNPLKFCGRYKPTLMSQKSKFCPQS
jgi:hypothetical protein